MKEPRRIDRVVGVERLDLEASTWGSVAIGLRLPISKMALARAIHLTAGQTRAGAKPAPS